MSIEKIQHSGAWCISNLINGHLVTRTYYGYTKREAIAMFKEEAK